MGGTGAVRTIAGPHLLANGPCPVPARYVGEPEVLLLQHRRAPLPPLSVWGSRLAQGSRLGRRCEPVHAGSAIDPLPRARVSRRRRVLQVGPTVLGVGFVALLAASRSGEIGEAVGHFGGIRPSPFAAAIAIEFVSVAMMAGLQHHLVARCGTALRRRTTLALMFSQNAIYLTHPAGPVLANTYAFRQYRRRGGKSASVGWALVTANVLSTIGLVVLSVVGTRIDGGLDPGTAVTAGGMIVALLLSVAVVQRPHAFQPIGRVAVRGCQKVVRRPREDAAELVDRWAHQLATVRLRLRNWVAAFGFAVLNWVFDITALALAVHAAHVRVSVPTLVLAYGLGQAAQSMPFTPGGLGIFEFAVAAAFVHAGVPAPQALAGVLLYRMISFWGMVLVGWTCWAGVRRGNNRAVLGPHLLPAALEPVSR